jgi:hypothetical protein
MAILSVDLAYRRWSDLGVVVLDRTGAARQPVSFRLLPAAQDGSDRKQGSVACEILPFSAPEPGADDAPIDANVLAGRLNHLCGVRGIRMILLDGPQAWKSGNNGLAHARVSEQQLNTAAKTGLPGMVKPLTYRPFAEFCLDVYDGLCRRGWRRLETREQPGGGNDRVLVESYPHAAWKSLGLKPLPAKRRAQVSDLAEAYAALNALLPFTTNRPPNHDQLQAIVGGLAGLALEERNAAGARIVGNPPRREEGHWREGFIVLPLPPAQPIALRWLN